MNASGKLDERARGRDNWLVVSGLATRSSYSYARIACKHIRTNQKITGICDRSATNDTVVTSGIILH